MCKIFTDESCMPKRRKLCNAVISTILWPFLTHIRVMFCYLRNIFASRFPKWLQFSLKSYMPYKTICWIIKNILGPCLAHIRTMFRQFIPKLCIYIFLFTYWDPIGPMFGPYEGHVLAISTVYWFLVAWNGLNFHWRVMQAI